MTAKQMKVLAEAPLKDLARLTRDQITQVALKVRRRSANGRDVVVWANRRDYPIENIANGQLERDLMEAGGGGNYIVQMFNNDNPLEALSPRWQVPLEGQAFDPSAARALGGPGGGLGGLGGGFRVPGAPAFAPHNIGGVNVPASAMTAGFPLPPVNALGEIMGPPPPNLMGTSMPSSFDYKSQWQHAFDTAAQPGGALDPAHQVSVDFAHRFDDRRESTLQQVAVLQEKLANEKETHVERMFALQQQNQGGGLAAIMPLMMHMMQQQNQQQERAAQAAMQQQAQNMQMMLAMVTREPPKSQTLDANVLAALAAAVVPVATAFISNGSQRHQAQIQAQMKQQELHMQQQQAFQQMFLQGQQQKTDIPALLTAGAPILAAVMTARQGRDELALQRADQQSQNSMMQLKMVADMVAEQAQNSGNPDLAELAMRLIAEVLPQMPQVIGALRGGSKPAAQVQQQPPRALPGAQGAASQNAGVALTPAQQAVFQRAQQLPQATDGTDYNTSVANWAGLLEVDDDAADATAWVLENHLAKMGPPFTSIAWREAVFHAHHLSDPGLTADRFRRVIDEAYNEGHFPEMVMTALETNTRQVLESVMSNMPVTEMHPDYMRKVLDVFMERLNADQAQTAARQAPPQPVVVVQRTPQPPQTAQVAKPAPPAAPTAQQAAEGAPTKNLRVVPAVVPGEPVAGAYSTAEGVFEAGPADDDDEDDEDDDEDDDDGEAGEELGPEALGQVLNKRGGL